MKRLPCLIGLILALLVGLNLQATMVVIAVGNGGNFFSPANFTINPGDTVKWVWVAGFHNTSNFTRPAGAPSWYGDITSLDTSFYYVPTVSGFYTYTCTYHSGMDGSFFVTGCTFPDMPVIASATTGSKCLGDTMLLQVPPQNGVGYQWIEGVSTIPASNTPDLKVANPGVYKVLVNRCGVDSVSDPFTVVFDTVATPDFTYNNSGFNYSFINGIAPGDYAFTWKFSDGSPDQTTMHATHSFAAPGQYVVKLIIRDTIKGCMDSVSKQIVVQPSLFSDNEHLSPFVYCDDNEMHVDLGRAYSRLDIMVNDIMGRIIISKTQYYASKFSFITGEISGMYFIRIRIDNEKLVNLKALGCN